MAKRIYIKVGDVFSVKIDEKHKKYFQIIAKDSIQLYSEVIRAFETPYLIEDKPDVKDVVQDKVSFYAHCVIRFGFILEAWEKEGSVPEIGCLDQVIFHETPDWACRVKGQLVEKTHRWYVWKIYDQKRTYDPQGLHRNAEIGIVLSPTDIVTRMKTGSYDFQYPEFGPAPPKPER